MVTDILYIIISKKYDIQAITDNKDYMYKFVNLLDGYDACTVIKTNRKSMNLPDDEILNNKLFEWQDILLTFKIDLEIMEYLDNRQREMQIYVTQMMQLLKFYKFTDEEQVFVNKFIDIYDYYFVKDEHGYALYDINEEIDFTVLFKQYLRTKRKNK